MIKCHPSSNTLISTEQQEGVRNKAMNPNRGGGQNVHAHPSTSYKRHTHSPLSVLSGTLSVKCALPGGNGHYNIGKYMEEGLKSYSLNIVIYSPAARHCFSGI